MVSATHRVSALHAWLGDRPGTGAQRRIAATLLAFVLLAPGGIMRAEEASPPDSVGTAPQSQDELEGTARRTLIPLPFVIYTPETRLGGGGAITYSVRPDTPDESVPPSTYGVFFLLTAREQYFIGLGLDRYSNDGRWHVLLGGYLRRFPTTYFGIGNATDGDISQDFTPQGGGLTFTLERDIRGPWSTGPTLAWASERVVERDAAPPLLDSTLAGYDGGNVLTLGWVLTRDTRSDVYYPATGGYLQGRFDVSESAIGSDFDYSQLSLDARFYRSLGSNLGSSPILAVRALGTHAAGTPPFQLLPALGGERLLRGFFEGRFRDRNLLALQSELRVGGGRRLGGVVFVSTGQVAHRPSGFRLDGFHFAYGLGLRVRLSKKEAINVRVDIGLSDEGGGGFYLNFLEAF